MAVDRGELRYIIRVQDQFSAGLKKFRAEVAKARKDLRSLQNQQAAGMRRQQTDFDRFAEQTRREGERAVVQKQRQIDAVSKAEAKAQRDAARARRQADAGQTRAQNQRIREIQAGIKRQAQIEKERVQIRRAETQALAQQARQFEKEETARQKRALNAQTRHNRAVKEGATGFRAFARNAAAAEGPINRISFTFRRMIGIFAAFQAARYGASLFVGMIRSGVEFNQTLEDTAISLASVFAAAGEVSRTFDGPALSGAEAFTAAIGEARNQTEQLRIDALGTVGTFQELQRAFQSGVGPGLEAGLSLDEIRETTIRISQAAAALTIPQNQLNEEIRSLLRGTINQRTTLIASTLGITSEEIKNAKKAGNLIEFLREELGPFAEAAEMVQNSFTGLSSNVKDAFQAIAGEASVGLFNTLKDSLRELFDTLVSIDKETQKITLNPEVIASLTPLFDALAATLKDLRQAAGAFNLDNLAITMASIGNALRLIANIGAGVLSGITQGVRDLAGVFSSLFGSFGEDSLKGMREWVSLITRIGTVLLGVNLAMAGLSTLMKVIISPLTTVASGFLKVAGAIGAVKTAILAGVLIGVGAVLFLLKQVVDKFAGFDVKFSTFVRILKDGFFNMLKLIGANLELVFVTIFEGIKIFAIKAFQFILRQVANLVAKAAEVAGIVSDDLQDGLNGVSASISRFAKTGSQTAEDAAVRISVARAKATNALFRFYKDLNDAINNDKNAPSGKELADKFLGGLKENLTKGMDAIFGDLFPTDTDDPDKKGEEDGEAYQKAFIRGKKKAEDEADSPITAFFEGIVENFEKGLDLVRQSVQALSAFISDSIVDAFDPTTDTSLQDRFAKFLQSIAKMVIKMLVELAIAKAVLGLTELLGSTGGGTTGTVAAASRPFFDGFAEGGEIPSGRAAPKMMRPKGLDRRDTTPIMAQPGEFMIRLAAAKTYGRDVMEAINNRLVDPAALRALIGSKRSHRHIAGMSKRSRLGYAEGGMIQANTTALRTATASAPSGSSPRAVPAVVVGNDQTMEKLLSGGGQAFRRYLSDNAQEIDGILRRGRTGG